MLKCIANFNGYLRYRIYYCRNQWPKHSAAMTWALTETTLHASFEPDMYLPN